MLLAAVAAMGARFTFQMDGLMIQMNLPQSQSMMPFRAANVSF
jgi:hypothetical protein